MPSDFSCCVLCSEAVKAEIHGRSPAHEQSWVACHLLLTYTCNCWLHTMPTAAEVHSIAQEAGVFYISFLGGHQDHLAPEANLGIGAEDP